MAARTGPGFKAVIWVGLRGLERPDRTWVIVTIPTSGPVTDPEQLLDAVSAVIRETNASEQQSDSGTARAEAAIRNWWVHQQR